MNIFFTLLPFASCIISFVFAFLVFKRYRARRGPHLLLWGIGMVMYGIGGFCEAYYGVFGWNPLVFRLWYLFGALLVAAWLGQGTVYLLAKRKWADILMIVLGLASVYRRDPCLRRAARPRDDEQQPPHRQRTERPRHHHRRRSKPDTVLQPVRHRSRSWVARPTRSGSSGASGSCCTGSSVTSSSPPVRCCPRSAAPSADSVSVARSTSASCSARSSCSSASSAQRRR